RALAGCRRPGGRLRALELVRRAPHDLHGGGQGAHPRPPGGRDREDPPGLRAPPLAGARPRPAARPRHGRQQGADHSLLRARDGRPVPRAPRRRAEGAARGRLRRVAQVFNDANDSQYFLIPGLIVLVMTLVGALLTALVVAREWERGTIESLFVTPVQPGDILLGKTIPYFA